MTRIEDPIWFSPLNVIHHCNELNKTLTEQEKSSKKFRKVIEAHTVAIMLVGLMILEGNEYWIQVLDDKQKSPDILTGTYGKPSKIFDNFEYQEVEVVEYEKHSTGNIPDFLSRTKFSKNKSYDKDTVILCHVGGGATVNLGSEKDLEIQMGVINSSCPIIFLGATSPDAKRYKMIQLNPEVKTLIEFDPYEKLTTGKYIGVLNLKLGVRKEREKKHDEKHYPFEKIGYIPNTSGKYTSS